MSRCVRILSILAICLLVFAGAEAKKKGKGKGKDVRLPAGWPAITEQQAALQEVPYAKGAPAVVLLSSEEREWEELDFVRYRYFRRLKILTDAGIERYGSFPFHLYGDWRIKNVEARTVLPDGQIIDASENIKQERSRDGFQLIVVAFPQVQVGAILDLDINVTTDGLSVSPWYIQDRIPVLDTRFVLVPPVGLRFRSQFANVPPEAQPFKSFTIRTTQVEDPTGISAPRTVQEQGHYWQFENVEAIPELPNLPSFGTIAQTVFVILDHFRNELTYFPIAPDWAGWNERLTENWNDWMKKSHSETAALARQVTGEATDPLAKAEAIRRALKDRYEITWVGDRTYSDSPDELLQEGSGTTGALAALTVVMLRAVDVDANLAIYRRRAGGIVPLEFPVPALFDDLLVQIPGPDVGHFFSPAAEVSASSLPLQARGVLVMPLDGTSTEPVILPDFKSDENRVTRMVNATITPDGALQAKSTHIYHGLASQFMRDRLSDLSEDQQKQEIQNSLRSRSEMAGARLESFEISNLDDLGEDLELSCEFVVEGFASRAGKRMIVNPNLFEEVSAADWAAESREYAIDLGLASETNDNLRLRYPSSVAEVTLPQPGRLTAQPVGLYQIDYQQQGNVVNVRRQMKLDLYRFGREAYAGLKRWYTDIAKLDDQPIVLLME